MVAWRALSFLSVASIVPVCDRGECIFYLQRYSRQYHTFFVVESGKRPKVKFATSYPLCLHANFPCNSTVLWFFSSFLLKKKKTYAVVIRGDDS